jgi:Asp-tRNA(Asn)/Glu-tRNA(Gln) amidotransferase C subunit
MKLTTEQIKYIKTIAKILVDDGENEEYTRGITELIAELDPLCEVDHGDRSDQIKHELLNS